MNRTKKQVFFFIIWLCILSFTGALFYYIFSPAPTCFDHKQNQKEKGVDCGGPCAPCRSEAVGKNIKIIEKALVDGGNGTYDVMFKVSNPNGVVGVSSFEYNVILKDANGSIIAEKTNSTFILPSDTRYVTEIGIKPDNNALAQSVEITISNITWKELEGYDKPQLNIYNKKYNHLPSGGGSELEGILRNDSLYDLGLVNIVAVLRDQDGKVVGLNMTQKDSVRSKEERSFTLNWPYEFKSSVSKIEIEAQSNIFDAGNFIKSGF